MSNLATVYEDDENYSPGRENAKSLVRDTGTAIVAIATTKQIGLACPTDTSSGLVKNVLYVVDYDTSFNRIEFVPVFHEHVHDADTAEAGGHFFRVYMANANNAQQISNYNAFNMSDWLTSFGASGTLTTDITEISHVFDTGTTTGSQASGTIAGIIFEFGFPMSFQWGAKCSHNANILTRIGINVDTVNQTPDTTIRKFGVEGCDGHGTNWVMINGNGNSGSEHVTATTAPLNPANTTPYAITHEPGTADKFYLDRVLNATSNTNVASDGATSKSRTMRAGIKLPTGTTAKKLHIRYYQFIGNTSGELMNIYI